MSPDPFDVLGLPPCFALAAADLNGAYLSRASRAHPDSVNVWDAESDTSSALNKAREILADPERRAEALLARLGGPGPSADRILPPGFLVEIMDLREHIEAARAAVEGSRANWQAQWHTEASRRREGHIRQVAELFDRFDSSHDLALLVDIRRELNVWRYTERLLEQLDAGSEAM